RDAARVVDAVVDHPAPLALALLLRAVVLVALRVGADVLTVERAVEGRADRGAVPPGEELAEEVHAPRVSANPPPEASEAARLPLDLVPGGDAELARAPAVEFEHRHRRRIRQDALLGIGHRVLGDIDDPALGID